MPNSFGPLPVPPADGVGPSVDVTLGSTRKSFALVGAVPRGGRYVVEGSTDGGVTFDALLGLPGENPIDEPPIVVVFTSDNAGVKTVEAAVTHLRVRAAGVGTPASPPQIFAGAEIASGTGMFSATLPVNTNGLGGVVDVGIDQGEVATFTCRGTIGPGKRFNILASMDGTAFDPIGVLFTGDSEGTKSAQVKARFFRVLGSGGGPAPTIGIAYEGISGGGSAQACPVVAASDDGRTETSSGDVEELVLEWFEELQPLAGNATIRASLACLGFVDTPGEEFHLKFYVGGDPGVINGTLVGQIDEVPGSTTPAIKEISANVANPAIAGGVVPVKVTLQSSAGIAETAIIRGAHAELTCAV